MQNRAGLKKVVKTVRGKKGTVRRSYWVKSNPKAAGNRAGAAKPGFLARHGGKLAAGVALGALALANRHKLMGAGRGVGLALNAHKHSGQNAPAMEKAKDAFRAAKLGYASNRGMDVADRAGASLRKGLNNHHAGITNWRRSVGADLAHHLATTGGAAAAQHVGSKAGGYAGAAIGGMFGGPAGSAVGGFIGSQAGGFLSGRHTEKHIKRAASWAADRLRR